MWQELFDTTATNKTKYLSPIYTAVTFFFLLIFALTIYFATEHPNFLCLPEPPNDDILVFTYLIYSIRVTP